jgi:hypothetical protein
VEHSMNIASMSQRRWYSRHWRGGTVSCSNITPPANTQYVGTAVTAVSECFKFGCCLNTYINVPDEATLYFSHNDTKIIFKLSFKHHQHNFIDGVSINDILTA